MPHALKFKAVVQEGGRLPEFRRDSIRSYLNMYVGKEIGVSFGNPQRSTKANSYYWAGVLPAVRYGAFDAGYELPLEALHTLFKERYVDPIIHHAGDMEIVVLTTTQLDSTQFYDYIEAIRNDEFVLALGVTIPEPEEKYRSYSIQDKPIT